MDIVNSFSTDRSIAVIAILVAIISMVVLLVNLVKKRTLTIEVKYHNNDIEKLRYIGDKSDWIDLRAAERVELKAGESAKINLGVSMRLPRGWEAHLQPRSSTFDNWGIIQTNSVGQIDVRYSGTDDVWKMPVYAMRDTVIEPGDRICQFRVERIQPRLVFVERDKLDGQDRGGFGSTGKN